MTYRGRVKNGVVVLDQQTELPEGQEVSVRVLKGNTLAHSEPRKTVYELMEQFAGIVDGPSDLAENHDHYAHGRPKK